ncbi:MAG: XisI protein [Pseudomonadota bacterium]
MGGVNQYQKVIRDVMAEYAAFLTAPPTPKYKVALALDDEHGQYILRSVGWAPKERYQYTDLHLMIDNGKIWIEEDMTEDGITQELVAQGVPREDIILGFQPPYLRS